MTILADYVPNNYTGNGATAVYPFTFKVLDEGDLLVIRTNLSSVPTTLQVNVDFTVTGEGNPTGGTVTLLAGNLTSGFGLFIGRSMLLRQPTSLRTQGAFRPEALEESLDRITMLVQQAGSPASGALVGLSVYTTATKPIAGAAYNDKFIILKDANQPAYLQICLQNADGSYAWATVATGNP